MAQKLALDFCNQEGKVGAVKAQPRRGDAVMFDVGGDMLVMRVSRRQCEVMRMTNSRRDRQTAKLLQD